MNVYLLQKTKIIEDFIYRKKITEGIEFLLILTWFFIWEGFSLGWLDRRNVKNHRYDLLRIYNAKITFVCDENQK